MSKTDTINKVISGLIYGIYPLTLFITIAFFLVEYDTYPYIGNATFTFLQTIFNWYLILAIIITPIYIIYVLFTHRKSHLSTFIFMLCLAFVTLFLGDIRNHYVFFPEENITANSSIFGLYKLSSGHEWQELKLHDAAISMKWVGQSMNQAKGRNGPYTLTINIVRKSASVEAITIQSMTISGGDKATVNADGVKNIMTHASTVDPLPYKLEKLDRNSFYFNPSVSWHHNEGKPLVTELTLLIKTTQGTFTEKVTTRWIPVRQIEHILNIPSA